MDLHELTRKIGTVYEQQEIIALGTFFNIEGAFDNIPFDLIKRTVRNDGMVPS